MAAALGGLRADRPLLDPPGRVMSPPAWSPQDGPLGPHVKQGLAARDRAVPSGHTKWRPAGDRPDPVALLEEQGTTREPGLVPMRHGRMMANPDPDVR